MFGNRPPALGCRPQTGALQPGCQREEAVQPPLTPPTGGTSEPLRYCLPWPAGTLAGRKAFSPFGKKGKRGPRGGHPSLNPPNPERGV